LPGVGPQAFAGRRYLQNGGREGLMKKKYISVAIVALVIIVILSMALYPTVSDYVNSRSQSRAVVGYIDDVAGMDGAHAQALLEAARVYNQTLRRKADRFAFTQEETAVYKKLLDTGRGVMGILNIDKIGVKLPIYHGTDEGVLQAGLGHLQGTSLPVGGIGTHSLITGHRGLPSSKLLSNLDKMAEGDVFILHILNETLTYRVDQITIVEPDEVSALDIEPTRDYCTIVTCTPYGINSHRLLVRGYRIENALNTALVYADARQLDKLLTILVFLLPAIPILAAIIGIGCRKIHLQGRFAR